MILSMFIFCKILITILYFVGFLTFPFRDKKFFAVNFPKQFWQLFTFFRICNKWSVFTKNGPIYKNIIIKAISNKKQYIWDIRFSRKIGDIKFSSDVTKLTVAHYYKQWFHIWMNDYFFQHIKNYLYNNKEELIYFEIKELYFDNLTREIINQQEQEEMKPLFKWSRKVDNMEK